jgi:mevalonate kinase
MLLGEHAVLHGFEAVVCAVDRHMFAELIPNDSDCIRIHSKTLGYYKTNIKDLKIEKPFQFILQALAPYQAHFPSGFDLHIDSEFSSRVGLGSSAAVTVVTLAVLEQWLFGGELDLHRIYIKGVDTIRAVQGVGSGADIAASVFGGVLAYRVSPIKIEKLPLIPQISLVYTGYKTPTPIVVNKVEVAYGQRPALFDKLFIELGECTRRGITAIQKQNWQRLSAIFSEHQKLQKLMGVSDQTIDTLVEACQRLSTVLGAKISGSGLGDCVVTLGSLPKDYFPMNETQRSLGIVQIDVQITNEGCRKHGYEKQS